MKVKAFLKLLVLFFLFGYSLYTFGQTGKLENNKSFLTEVQISEADKIKVFENCWQAVNRLYFDPTFNGTNWSKLHEIYLPQAIAAKDKIELVGVLNKLLGEVKTSHLEASFEATISGKTIKEFFGEKVDFSRNEIVFDYGFSTAKSGEQTVVIEVEKDSSADAAGVKPGWIIKSFKTEARNRKNGDFLIHSEAGNFVFLTEKGEEKILTLDKSFYLKPRSSSQRDSKIINGKILYLKFNSFDKGIGKWTKSKLTENSSTEAVIIDLRNNTGGWVDEVKETLSLFLPPKTAIGKFTERDLDEKIFRAGSNDFYKSKVVVLIDGNSISGAEIFAAAFQETGRGTIVGQRSAGRVLNGISKSLSSGLRLYIAIRDYRTAKGVRLEGKGVAPDVEIPLTLENFLRQEDIVLDKALEILRIQ